MGPGRVGRSLAPALARAGSHVSVHLLGRADRALDLPSLPSAAGPTNAPSLESATASSTERPTSRLSYLAVDRWRELPSDLPLELFLCVPDDALPAAVSAWARRLTSGADFSLRHAFHTSGVRSASDLAFLREATGATVASFHPLRAIFTPDPEALEGVIFGVEGDAAAVARAGELADRLGARTLQVRPDEKPRYHAAAVFASNLLVAGLAVARRELARAAAGPVPDDALLRLARSALVGVGERGLEGGLTGPVARRDWGTVARHLEVLDPPARAVYAMLTRVLARELAGLSEEEREALERILEAGAADGPEEASRGADDE